MAVADLRTKNSGLFALKAQPSHQEAEKKKQRDQAPNHDTADVVGREDLAKISVRPGEKSSKADKDTTNRDNRGNRIGRLLLAIIPGGRDPIAVKGHDQERWKETQNKNRLRKRDLFVKKIDREKAYPRG